MKNDEGWKNKLWFGDNLEVLRDRDNFPNDFVDLIYLDPPFNSNANYNMLFKESTGEILTSNHNRAISFNLIIKKEAGKTNLNIQPLVIKRTEINNLPHKYYQSKIELYALVEIVLND